MHCNDIKRYERGIAYLHKLVRRAEDNLIESEKFVARAAEEEMLVIRDLARAVKVRNRAAHYGEEIFELLEKLAPCGQCNVDCPECQAIAEQIILVFEQLVELEDGALALAEQLFATLKQLIGLYEELRCLIGQYKECIHPRPCPPPVPPYRCC